MGKKQTKKKFAPVVLIIEDNLEKQQNLKKELTQAGFSVLVASNGGEGLRELHKKPDMVILDMFLPRMNAFHFLEFKDTNPNLRDIPMYILSDTQKESEVKEAFGQSAIQMFHTKEEQQGMIEKIKKSIPPAI